MAFWEENIKIHERQIISNSNFRKVLINDLPEKHHIEMYVIIVHVKNILNSIKETQIHMKK